MSISNENEENRENGEKVIESQSVHISSRVEEQKENMKMWLLKNIEGITFSVLDTYVSVLYEDGIGSMARLARKIERDKNYLYSLSAFDDMDIEDITRKLGVVSTTPTSSAREKTTKQKKRPSLETAALFSNYQCSSESSGIADRVITRKRDLNDIMFSVTGSPSTAASSAHKPSTSSSAVAKGGRDTGLSARTTKEPFGNLFAAPSTSLTSPRSSDQQPANKKPRVLSVEALMRDADILNFRSEELFETSHHKKSSLDSEDAQAQRNLRKKKKKPSVVESRKDSGPNTETLVRRDNSSRGSGEKRRPVRQKNAVYKSKEEALFVGSNVEGKAKNRDDKSKVKAASRLISGSKHLGLEDDFSFLDHAVFMLAPRGGGGENNGSSGDSSHSKPSSPSGQSFKKPAITAAVIRKKQHPTSRFPLIAACLQKDETAVKRGLELLSSSPDPLDILEQLEISDPDLDDQTALQVAIDTKHAGIVALLLQAGANMNISDRYGVTALIQASLKGAAEIMKLLISHGALLNTRDLTKGRSALSCACKCGYSLCVRVLLNAGASTEIRDNDGETPLISAARWGHLDCVKLLIRAGADPKAVDRRGHTAFFLATREERLACARFLETGCHSPLKDGNVPKAYKQGPVVKDGNVPKAYKQGPVVKFDIATNEIVALYRSINEAHHETGYSYKRMRDSVLSSAHGAQLGDAIYRFLTPDDILPPAVVTASKQLHQKSKQPGRPRHQPSSPGRPSVSSSSSMAPLPAGLPPGVHSLPQQVLLRHKESGTVAVVDVVGKDPTTGDIIWRPPLSSQPLGSAEHGIGALSKKSMKGTVVDICGAEADSSPLLTNSSTIETPGGGRPSSGFGSSPAIATALDQTILRTVSVEDPLQLGMLKNTNRDSGWELIGLVDDEEVGEEDVDDKVIHSLHLGDGDLNYKDDHRGDVEPLSMHWTGLDRDTSQQPVLPTTAVSSWLHMVDSHVLCDSLISSGTGQHHNHIIIGSVDETVSGVKGSFENFDDDARSVSDDDDVEDGAVSCVPFSRSQLPIAPTASAAASISVTADDVASSDSARVCDGIYTEKD